MTGGPRAALLTGPSPGAIGAIRVHGPGAFEAVRASFRSARGGPLRRSDAGRPRLGRMARGEGDEVVVLVMEGDPPAVEVHGHGGAAALASILDDLRARGVAIVTPDDEQDRRLSRASTLRVADILLDQAGGAFGRELARLDDLARVDRDAAGREIETLLRRAAVGLRLDEGWDVALAGLPNAGKSRLLNAIAGYDRAIVSPVAGTTRDVITAKVAIDGWPVALSDTAGARDSAQGLEALGIALGRESAARADLVVIVLDRSRDLTEGDRALIAARPGALKVANKSDLPAAWRDEGVSEVSAATGHGLAGLLTAIAARIVPEPPPPGAIVPVTPEQVARLESLTLRVREPR